jgi:hypothetical protein
VPRSGVRAALPRSACRGLDRGAGDPAASVLATFDTPGQAVQPIGDASAVGYAELDPDTAHPEFAPTRGTDSLRPELSEVVALRVARGTGGAQSPLPDFIEDVAAVCGLQPDQSSMIDPAIDRSASRAGIEQQVAAGGIRTKEPVEKAVARAHPVDDAQLPARGRELNPGLTQQLLGVIWGVSRGWLASPVWCSSSLHGMGDDAGERLRTPSSPCPGS